MGAQRIKYLLSILLLAVVGIILYKGKSRSVSVPSFYSGVVEATEHKLAFERGGLLDSLEADEGDRVGVGQVLARLDTRELRAQAEAAEAALAAARAQLDKLQTGSRPQEVETVRARLDRAKAELERLRNGPTTHQLAQARAQMKVQQQSYQKIRSGFRAEDIKAARAQRDAARIAVETAQADARRFAALYQMGAVAAQRFEQAQSRYESARGNYVAAEEEVRKLESGYLPQERGAAYQGYQAAKAGYQELAAGTRPEVVAAAQSEVRYWSSQLSLAEEGSRSEEIEAAAANVRKAEAEIKSLQVQLSKSQLVAPVAGVITARPYEDGEFVPAGPPVFTVAELSKPWVAVFVPEPELAQVQLGAQCRVTVDSLPGQSIDGRVSWISENAEFTPRFVQTERQRVDLVFRVKVELENSDLKLKPGMPADVRVLRDNV